MKYIQLIFITSSAFLLLSGCWDREEINDVSLITGVAFDKTDDEKLEITIEQSIPNASSSEARGSGGEQQTTTQSATGLSIPDALENLEKKISREVFWSHTEVIVISKDLARGGIRDELDFFLRHHEPRMRAYVFISRESAKDIMKLTPIIERSSSEVLKELAEAEVLMHVTLLELLEMFQQDGSSAAIPMIDIEKPPIKEKSLQTIAYLHRTAILEKGKFTGSVGDQVTRGMMWFTENVYESLANIPLKNSEKYIAMRLTNGKSQLIPKIENGQWEITLKLITDGNVLQNESSVDLNNPDKMTKLENMLEKRMEKRLQKTLNKVQAEFQADVLGFGEAFRRKYPEIWKKSKDNWEEIYPEVKVSFDIKSNVIRLGRGSAPKPTE
ncbi:Ger(x)C family spore germination protein [Alteribacillus sp. HJP-4]|uniref:Ger(x)C family spore germination protein n=1 Tax=Alteribacillus sp. HJP-4 TaxID=2775394 RepID=UPI0035CD3BC3